MSQKPYKSAGMQKKGTTIRAYTEGILRLISSQTFKVPTSVIQGRLYQFGLEKEIVKLSHETCYIS